MASSVVGVPALERAAAHGVPSAVFPRAEYEDRKARDSAMADWLQEREDPGPVLAAARRAAEGLAA